MKNLARPNPTPEKHKKQSNSYIGHCNLFEEAGTSSPQMPAPFCEDVGGGSLRKCMRLLVNTTGRVRHSPAINHLNPRRHKEDLRQNTPKTEGNQQTLKQVSNPAVCKVHVPISHPDRITPLCQQTDHRPRNKKHNRKPTRTTLLGLERLRAWHSRDGCFRGLKG